MTETEILIAIAVFLVAGMAKGLIGIGLPTITISLLIQIMDPRQAIVLTLAPVFFANLWQCYRVGMVMPTIRRYALFLGCLFVVMLITARLSFGLSSRNLTFVIGAVVVCFTLVQLFLKPPPLEDKYDRIAQFGAGSIAGVLGGLTALWGPAVLMYLIARRTPKDEFVSATGVMLVCGFTPLFYSYWSAGLLSFSTGWVSVTLVIPTVLGFAVGEHFRSRLNPEGFQRAVLLMFLLLGLNILRRAIWGG